MIKSRNFTNKVSYKLRAIKKSYLKKLNIPLLTHDEVVNNIIKTSYQNEGSNTNIALESNYKWVYKPNKRDVYTDEDKILIIPAMSLCKNPAKANFIRIIYSDKNARFNEIHKIMQERVSKGFIGFAIDASNFNFMLDHLKDLFIKSPQKTHLVDEYIPIEDAIFKFIPNKLVWKSIDEWLQSNIQFEKLLSRQLIENYNPNTFDLDFHIKIFQEYFKKRVINFNGPTKNVKHKYFTIIPNCNGNFATWVEKTVNKLKLKESDLNLKLCKLQYISHGFKIDHYKKFYPVNESNYSSICRWGDYKQPYIFKEFPKKLVEEWVKDSIDSNVQNLAEIGDVQMMGGVRLKTLLQGRDSIIRKSLVRRVPAFRGQILLRPELAPNQVLVPLTWQNSLVPARKIIDSTDPSIIDPSYFHDLGEKSIILKRDPVINPCSVVICDKVGYINGNNIYISPAIVGHQNADFDGDTEGLYISDNPLTKIEIALNALPQNCMRVAFVNRASFVESQVFIMHQRNLPKDYKYTELYNNVRSYCIAKWKNDKLNQSSLDKLNELVPNFDFDQFIEPTREILETTLAFIAEGKSSREAYDFYNYINTKIVELANGQINDLYDPNLPAEMFMERSLLSKPLIKAVFSGSIGSIAGYIEMLKILHDIDGTFTITKNNPPIDIEKWVTDSTTIGKNMARSTKQVQINGHKFFKNNISFDSISFDSNGIYSNGVKIAENIKMPRSMLFSQNYIGILMK